MASRVAENVFVLCVYGTFPEQCIIDFMGAVFGNSQACGAGGEPAVKCSNQFSVK